MTSEYEAYELKLTTLKVSFLERDNAPKWPGRSGQEQKQGSFTTPPSQRVYNYGSDSISLEHCGTEKLTRKT